MGARKELFAMPDSQKLVIETRYDAFVASIGNWDGAMPSFQECVASALFIASTMGEADRFLGGVVADSGLDIDVHDVTNWATGAPLREDLRPRIVAALAPRLRECQAEARRRLGITDPVINTGAPSADGFEE